MTWIAALIGSIASVLFGYDEGIIGMLLMLEAPRGLSLIKPKKELILDNESQQELSFFRNPLLPTLMLGVLLFCLQQLSGINVILYFAPEIFKNLGFNTFMGQILAIIGIGLINALVAVIAMMSMNKIGRRTLLLFGLSGMFLSLLVLCIGSLIQPVCLPYLSVACLIIYIFSFVVSAGQIPSGMGNWILNTVIILSCFFLEKIMGIEWTFILYVAICLLGLIYTYFYIPKTKNISLEYISRLFQQ
jgi:hypothetical protein